MHNPRVEQFTQTTDGAVIVYDQAVCDCGKGIADSMMWLVDSEDPAWSAAQAQAQADEHAGRFV